MKFVCLNCETYMNLEKVEKPGEGSLGVFFGCPSCNAKFSMVTNAGETKMMDSLGLKLNPRAETPDPIVAALADKMQKAQPVTAAASAPAKAGEKTGGGCPF
ncbi:MAG: hypothetical protein HP495_12905, partial [Nitrospira sp.]|nr:hypothetical protein [Nitrospira sp.]